MGTWTQGELAAIADADELSLASFRGDGTLDSAHECLGGCGGERAVASLGLFVAPEVMG
jgi:hypothetical protein